MTIQELNNYIDDHWQAIEQKHLRRNQIGVIRDMRQLEILRKYLETL